MRQSSFVAKFLRDDRSFGFRDGRARRIGAEKSAQEKFGWNFDTPIQGFRNDQYESNCHSIAEERVFVFPGDIRHPRDEWMRQVNRVTDLSETYDCRRRQGCLKRAPARCQR